MRVSASEAPGLRDLWLLELWQISWQKTYDKSPEGKVRIAAYILVI